MNLTLLNSHFELPADHWYHVVPLGEFRHAEGDLLQVIDDRAVQSMVERFQHESAAANFPGLLVDFDHASQHATQPTAAAGWITELQAVTPRDPPALSPETRHRTPGLWAQIRWSDTGEAAVRGGRYRLVSPVWLAEDCEALPTRPTSLTDLTSPTGPTAPAHRINRPTLRPLRLHRLALTNDPNLRGMVPLSNRTVAAAPADHAEAVPIALTQGQPAPAAEADAASHRTTRQAAPRPHENTTATRLNADARLASSPGPTLPLSSLFQTGNDARLNHPRKEPMQTISVALGLSADTAEEAVLSEIAHLKNRATQAEARAQTLEKQSQEWLSSQVERDLELHAHRFAPEFREKWKTALLANRTGTLELLNSLPAPETPATPAPRSTPSAGPLHQRATAKTPAGLPLAGTAEHRTAQLKAVREYQNRHQCHWQTAWDTVRAESPGLF